ncbi:scavenger receptor class F member 2-like [Haliotis rubra]|uniref:scavenger receptor class F member 2-like n=1 Tax=Haliotis rubra TaxID=36100 RepID=UPI001EE5F808|nr:scavenger receptor class F member 2-like [Haliotis rubra]
MLIMLESVHSLACGQCTAIPYPIFNDHISPLYQVWTRTKSVTVAECSSECYMSVQCRSFTYNRATQTCIGYSGSMSTPTRMGAVNQDGARTYLTCAAPHAIGHPCAIDADCHFTSGVCSNGVCDCAVFYNYDNKANTCIELPNLLDDPCTVDSDCSVANSVCKSSTSRCTCNYGNTYKRSVNQCTKSPDLHSTTCSSNSDCSVVNSTCLSGSCACDVGYSFNREENRCDQFCTVYGETYTGHGGIGVNYCNVASATTSTVEDCWKTCIGHTGFLCKNAEYDLTNKYCHMCDEAWFELSPEARSYSSPGWVTYFRNCGDSSKLFGQLCSSNGDCSAPNFICRGGTCVCDIGYSFNSSTNECVQCEYIKENISELSYQYQGGR